MREKNKGITLIALIITIIIMLILVGITIQVVINSNLFEIAQDAGNRTETAYQEESAMGGVTINGKDYESMDEYLNGVAPDLIYGVQGNIIRIATPSYENYITCKSIAEKEQAYAEDYDFDNIEALIEDWYAGSREDFEEDVMDFWGASTYEEALNDTLMDEGVLEIEFYENSEKLMNFIGNISKAEKEQAYAEDCDFDNIEALIEDWYDSDRSAWEADYTEYYGFSTYEETLNFLCAHRELFKNEYAEYMGGTVTVIDPSGVKHVLDYSGEEASLFTYKVTEDGDYKFTAVNNKGRTSELTVPVEIQWSTYTLRLEGWDSEANAYTYEVIGSYNFVLGEKWGDYDGKTLADGIEVSVSSYSRIRITFEGGNYDVRATEERGMSNMTKSTDVIVDGAIYTLYYQAM